LRFQYWLCALVGAAWLSLLPAGCSSSKPAGLDDGKRFGQSPDAFEAQRNLPPSTRTLYAMADLLAAQGKDRDAEFTLRRCIQQEPKFTPAYNKLAELMMRQGRVREAAEVLSQALRVNDADPILLNNLGMCCLVQRHYEEAAEQFTKAAGRIPDNPKFRANLATALALLGRYEESEALFQQILPDEQAKHNAEVLRKAHEKTLGGPTGIQDQSPQAALLPG
jgi:Flp pilus assembly protein TadD